MSTNKGSNPVVYIYALAEPDTGDVRYVGKTVNLVARFRAHLRDRTETRRGRWIRSLLRVGQKPLLFILEGVPHDNWQDAERHWITTYRAEGADLLNHTDGGEGLTGAGAETRAKIAEAQRKLWADPAYRRKILTPQRAEAISRALTGRQKAPEHVAKLWQNQPGYTVSPERAALLRKHLQEYGHRWLKGVSPTPETKARIAEALRGNTHTLGRAMPTHERLARSTALVGRTKSEEYRQKIAEGQRRAWARRKAMV